MRSELERVIDILKAQEGYLEKASNSSLDSKTANAGKGNYTKYGRDLRNWFPELGDTFGVAYAWCLELIVWAFCLAVGLERAKELLCNCLSAYTPTMAQAFMDAGRWSSKPQVGALVFFADLAKKSASRPYGIYHVGFVVGLTDTKIHTGEGNTSAGSAVVANGGCVAFKTYDIDNIKIFGYGIPDYDGAGKSSVADKANVPDGLPDLEAWRAYCEAAYTDILFRVPQPEELERELPKDHLWMVFYKTRNSEEGRKLWITVLYLLYLDRRPSEEELDTWYNMLVNGTLKRVDIIRKIKKSEEYRNAHKNA